MKLTEIENLSNTPEILRQLRAESRAAVLRDLEVTIYHHEAAALATEIKKRLAALRKEIKDLQGRKDSAEQEFNTLQDALTKLRQEHLAAIDLRARVVSGFAEGPKPNVHKIESDICDLERGPVGNARAELRTANHRLQQAEADMRGLEKLLQALPANGKPPETLALNLILEGNHG